MMTTDHASAQRAAPLPSALAAGAFLTDDARWGAVARRDPAADGLFYTAVRTTGVYCRPTCPGRPLRKNVCFYETCEEAEQAGFRACKRCRPNTAHWTGSSGRQDRRQIRYVTGACSLGTILVAASPAGLCAVLLGDEAGPMVRDLRDRFPQAMLTADAPEAAPGDGADLQAWLGEVIAMVDGSDDTVALSIPLDTKGTPFQERVWQALREIPAGATLSYGQLAVKVGAPRAVRAVGRACGANPVAVVIPCHRAVRSDGSLSGYRWGLARKRVLLDREAAVAREEGREARPTR